MWKYHQIDEDRNLEHFTMTYISCLQLQTSWAHGTNNNLQSGTNKTVQSKQTNIKLV